MANKFMMGRAKYGLLAGLVLLVWGFYLMMSRVGAGSLGYPLDDAWIHQTYARNWALYGVWAYWPWGEGSSTGSTAPLWTMLLALGYRLGVPYLWWSYGLGLLSWWGVIWLGMGWGRRAWPEWAGRDIWLGLVLVGSWPLAWAAVSGMETLLFAALGLGVLVVYEGDRGEGGWRRPLLMALLGSLLVLTRPDGIALLLLVVVGWGWRYWRRPWPVLLLLVGMGLLLSPYFWFNWGVTGQLWPSTLYAKQVEYGLLLERPLWRRLIELLYFSWGGASEGWRGLTGARLLLVPGLLVSSWAAVRGDWAGKELRLSLPLLWAGGHVVAYAWRLPVTYQHGRYLMPILPIWLLYGVVGWWMIGGRELPGGALLNWASVWVGRLTFGLLLGLFLLLGGQGYGVDVAFIEGEMVTVAHWLREHTAEGALIATHDIGAIGYFGERPLLDLAGLISPEVVGYLDDESRLSDYVLQSEAVYLVTAPGWSYPTVTTGMTPIYTTGYLWTELQGFNNMAVYRLQKEP